MGQHDMGDRLVRHLADLLDYLVRQPGRGLGLDDHHAVVADDDAGVRVALRREGPEILADLDREIADAFKEMHEVN